MRLILVRNAKCSQHITLYPSLWHLIMPVVSASSTVVGTQTRSETVLRSCCVWLSTALQRILGTIPYVSFVALIELMQESQALPRERRHAYQDREIVCISTV